MKYTIPYDDKITLPHIKKIESIGINADKLNYDSKELTGQVIITGDYLLDNSQDVMEFTHDIPISFLIDDEAISPQINISNFKHELIQGRGIEVMFDLDVILVEEKDSIVARDDEEEKTVEETEKEDLKEFQEKIDENLESVLQTRNKKEKKSEDKEERPLFKTKENKKKLEDEEDEQDITPEIVNEDIDRPKEIEEEDDITPEVIDDVLDEVYEKEEEDVKFNTYLQSTLTSFDTGFIPRDDKYTTYKILLVEDSETVETVLESRNLSKALICKEYQYDDKKIVLKLEDD